MRASEFIHYINRKDVALGRNVSDSEYTHISIKQATKQIEENEQEMDAYDNWIDQKEMEAKYNVD